VKLGTKAERYLAKHLHDLAARPAHFLREPRLRLLEPYFLGMIAAFRAEHERDPFSDSPWNSWAAFEMRSGYARAGAFAALEAAAGADGAPAFRKFLAYFNRFRKWAQARSCTALLEDARTASAVRRFFRSKAARVPRARLAARQYVTGAGRRFDAVIFRSDAWFDDEADGRENRVAIAILDGAAEPAPAAAPGARSRRR
jgi:hypothetical protein